MQANSLPHLLRLHIRECRVDEAGHRDDGFGGRTRLGDGVSRRSAALGVGRGRPDRSRVTGRRGVPAAGVDRPAEGGADLFPEGGVRDVPWSVVIAMTATSAAAAAVATPATTGHRRRRRVVSGVSVGVAAFTEPVPDARLPEPPETLSSPGTPSPPETPSLLETLSPPGASSPPETSRDSSSAAEGRTAGSLVRACSTSPRTGSSSPSRSGRPFRDSLSERLEVALAERVVAGPRVRDEAAPAEDVGRGCGGLPVQAFRRIDPGGAAHDHARDGSDRSSCRPRGRSPKSITRGPRRSEQDVGRLEVAMDQPRLVDRGQGPSGTGRERAYLLRVAAGRRSPRRCSSDRPSTYSVTMYGGVLPGAVGDQARRAGCRGRAAGQSTSAANRGA